MAESAVGSTGDCRGASVPRLDGSRDDLCGRDRGCSASSLELPAGRLTVTNGSPAHIVRAPRRHRPTRPATASTRRPTLHGDVAPLGEAWQVDVVGPGPGDDLGERAWKLRLAPVLIIFALADDLIERRSANGPSSYCWQPSRRRSSTHSVSACRSYAVEISSNETIRNWGGRVASPGSTVAEWGSLWLSGVVVVAIAVWKRAEVRSLDGAVLAFFFALGVPLRGPLVGAPRPPVVSLVPLDGTGHRRTQERSDQTRSEPSLRCSSPPPDRGESSRSGSIRGPDLAATRSRCPRGPGGCDRGATVGSRLFVYQPFTRPVSTPPFGVSEDGGFEDRALLELRVGTTRPAISGGEGWEEILDRHRIEGSSAT